MSNVIALSSELIEAPSITPEGEACMAIVSFLEKLGFLLNCFATVVRLTFGLDTANKNHCSVFRPY